MTEYKDEPEQEKAEKPPVGGCSCEWCQFNTALYGRRFLSLCTKKEG